MAQNMTKNENKSFNLLPILEMQQPQAMNSIRANPKTPTQVSIGQFLSVGGLGIFKISPIFKVKKVYCKECN